MRRRFVLVSLAVTALVVAVFAIPLAWLIDQFATDRAMAAAERQVTAVATVLAVTADPGEIADAVASTRAGRTHRLTVHLPGGGRTGPPGWVPADVVARVAHAGRSRTVPVAGGLVHLHPTTTVSRRVAVVEILVPDARLHHGVHTAWAGLAALVVLLLSAAAVLADRLAASAVRATQGLAAAADQLGRGDLSVRVDPDGPPEIATAGAAFNDLADRIGALLAGERELVADLSHRLRTPLTALRLAADSSPAGPERRRLSDAVDGMHRELDAIIQRARSPLTGAPAGHCDLRAVVTERVAFWSALADDQSRDWTLSPGTDPVPVAVPAAELESALDSVLGNVFQHTPERAAFGVRLHVDGSGCAVLTVDDAGPGMPAAADRGRSASSTGLGLSIARRVTRAAGGDVAVSTSPLGGTRVTLRFGPADGAPSPTEPPLPAPRPHPRGGSGGG